jgi:dihydrolipoamide dehydrogenase
VQLLAVAETPVSGSMETPAQCSPEGPPSDDNHGKGEIGSSKTLELSADCGLICTGRKPRLRVEELNTLGVRYDRRGIVVDQQQMTDVPGIYAVGDVTGGVMLAHRAMRQGKILASRLFGGREMRLIEDAVPQVIYTHPPIARVGMTESDALRKGIAVDVRRSDFAANLTARTSLSGPGFVKLLFDGDKLAGATIIGDQAGELISPLSLAMAAGLNRSQMEAWVIPHPTLSEVMGL